MGLGFFRAFRGLTPRAYAEVLDLACNRFGWEKAVVDAAPDIETIESWARARAAAFRRGDDYRTTITVISG